MSVQVRVQVLIKKKPYGLIHTMKSLFSFVLPFSFLLLLILFRHQSYSSLVLDPPSSSDSCSGRYIYIHDLPDRFNTGLLRNCHNLSVWTDMCQFVSNSGLGELLADTDGVLPPSGWYGTSQFALEVIFHNRLKQYDCLTTNSSMATAIFVPYYIGLDIGRHLWGYSVTIRDALLNELIQWLRSSHEWSIMGGMDHFMINGRTTWDMRRERDEDSHWGSKFMLLPETQNMTVLDIESNIWRSNEFGIPYPTYFHPSKHSDIVLWQEKVRSTPRPFLFSFAGARRKNQIASAIRDLIIEQCAASNWCELLECKSFAGKCRSPSSVMRLFQTSRFCLQPMGDSLTRRSLFDSILAGCIPVFFHPGSAFEQYKWHLPRDYTKYSVYIPEEEVREGRVKIEDVLLRYSEEQVKEMREEAIKLIPLIVYKDPRYRLDSVRDAFDVVIDGVIERMRGLGKIIK